jgi:hypothetical protein
VCGSNTIQEGGRCVCASRVSWRGTKSGPSHCLKVFLAGVCLRDAVFEVLRAFAGKKALLTTPPGRGGKSALTERRAAQRSRIRR